jgi:nitrogen fixation protein FixH
MTMAMETAPRRGKGELTGFHVLAMLLGLFGVMIAVNVVFVVLALKTFSGESDHAYVNGLRFNETIAANARQAEAGWRMRLDLQRDARDGARLVAIMTDRDGAPVRGAAITALIGRPTTEAQDKTLRFVETAPGAYVSDVVDLGPGKWRFTARARVQGRPDFTTETSLSLR